jgi:lactate permease
MDILIGLSPVIIIFVLLAFLNKPADLAGLVGWIAMGLVAYFYFNTPLKVVLMASFAGLLASLPITIMIAASMLQMTYMQRVGAIDRLIVLFKTLSHENKIVQILIINIGFGTLITALGAAPISILPPIMLALGYSSFVAIALPAIGYDALCTYALLGVPVIIFANFTGLTIDESGYYFARYMPVISTLIAFSMLWIAGKWAYIRKGWFPTLLTGVTAGLVAIFMNQIKLTLITGVAAGIAVIIVLVLYLRIKRQPIFEKSKLTPDDLHMETTMGLTKAFSPWIILISCSVIINLPGPLKELFFTTWSMPIDVIPGARPISLRVFFHAYWWIIVSTVLTIPLFKAGWGELKDTYDVWIKRAPRPTFSSAIYFSIAYVMNYSGMDSNFVAHPENNIVASLAAGSSSLFGQYYGLVAPYLGLLGGFISGTETSAIAMLTKFHLETANVIWPVKIGFLIAAASGIGAGLASVISPSKLQTAAAIIDRIGEESKVIRTTLILSIIITGACALMTFYWVSV